LNPILSVGSGETIMINEKVKGGEAPPPTLLIS
jgi:hypothetical protein